MRINILKVIILLFVTINTSSCSNRIYKKFQKDVHLLKSTDEFLYSYIDSLSFFEERSDEEKLKKYVRSKINLKDFNKRQIEILKSCYSKKEIKQIYKLPENKDKDLQSEALFYEEKKGVSTQLYGNGYKYGASLYEQVLSILNENIVDEPKGKMKISISDFKSIWLEMNLKSLLHFDKRDQYLWIRSKKNGKIDYEAQPIIRQTKYYLSNKRETWSQKRFLNAKAKIRSKKVYLITEKEGIIEVKNFLKKYIYLKQCGKTQKMLLRLQWLGDSTDNFRYLKCENDKK